MKLVLSLDRGLKMIEERECSEEDCELIQSLSKGSGSALPAGGGAGVALAEGKRTPNSSSGMDEASLTRGQEEEEEEEEGEWDMDSMSRASTDTYVLFTVCDSQSTMEVQPRRGIFDSFMPLSQGEDGTEEDEGYTA